MLCSDGDGKDNAILMRERNPSPLSTEPARFYGRGEVGAGKAHEIPYGVGLWGGVEGGGGHRTEMGYVGSAVGKTSKALWGWHPKLRRGQPKPMRAPWGRNTQTLWGWHTKHHGESTQNLMEMESRVPWRRYPKPQWGWHSKLHGDDNRNPIGVAPRAPWRRQPKPYGCSTQSSMQNASQTPQGRHYCWVPHSFGIWGG